MGLNIKLVSLLIFLVFLVSTISVSQMVQNAKATGTVYIRADGSVDPPSAPIQRADNIYAFTDSINDSIVVEKDNITIDGKGHWLQTVHTRSGFGISLAGRSNVAIRNLQIKSFEVGIWLKQASQNVISYNNLTYNNYAIWIEHSSNNNTIYRNRMTDNWSVGSLSHSLNNTIIENNITHNSYGISILNSSGNTLARNDLAMDHFSITLDQSVHNIVYENDIGRVRTSTAYPCVHLINSSDNVLLRNNITEGYYSILLWYSLGNTISENRITKNSIGIELFLSSNLNSISGNNITNNELNGIQIRNSSGNIVSENDIAKNYKIGAVVTDYSFNNTVSRNRIRGYGKDEIDDCGILLSRSSTNTISSNEITDAKFGIELDRTSDNIVSENNITRMRIDGIIVQSASNNRISENSITNNRDGIRFCESSNYNRIFGNNITNNDCGIYLQSSSSNTIYRNNIADNRGYVVGSFAFKFESASKNIIYHNNFINSVRVSLWFESTNVWDAGYPSGGNYWSDYAEKYPDASEIDGSGIWDTAYIIDANNQDNYPLMNSYISENRPIAIFSVDKQTAYLDEIVTFDASFSYDPDGVVISYWYDYGDGYDSGWISEAIHYRTYPEPGEYYAKLKVKDNNGIESDWSDLVKITIRTYMPLDKSAIIVDPFYGETGPFKDLLYKVQEYLESAGYSVSIMQETDVTVEWLRDGLRHGVVLWRGHTAQFQSEIGLLTDEKVTDENTKMYEEDIENHRIESISKGGVYYWVIKTEFIRHYYTLNRFQYSLVVVEGCASLSDTSLASTVVNIGAGSYVGYVTDVQEPLTSLDMITLFKNLCEKGYTVEEAVNSVFWGMDLLKYYGDSKLKLVTLRNTTPSIAFVIWSPANLYVKDPEGRCVGFDQTTSQPVVEIPEAMYTGSEIEPQVIWIPYAINGTYEVSLIGTASGKYNLTMGLSSLSETRFQTKVGTISASEILSFTVGISGTDLVLVPHTDAVSEWLLLAAMLVVATGLSTAYMAMRFRRHRKTSFPKGELRHACMHMV